MYFHRLHFRSAFFWFCNDERSKVKALNPEFGVGDIAKELGRRWSDVDPELKSKYEAMAEKDKARYDRVSVHLIMLEYSSVLCCLYTDYLLILFWSFLLCVYNYHNCSHLLEFA